MNGFDINVSVSALTVFVQGLLSFFSPCVLPALLHHCIPHDLHDPAGWQRLWVCGRLSHQGVHGTDHRAEPGRGPVEVPEGAGRNLSVR